MNLKHIIGKLLYSCIAVHLPVSYSGLQLGQRAFRGWCTRLMLDHCGQNINIERGAKFSKYVEIGDESGIGINCLISGKCSIGKQVMMGPDCIVYTRNHRFDDPTVPVCRQGNQPEKPVVIGDDVWIGARVIILPGVTVASHSVIGAGSVVTKDVPPWSIVAGNPAKVKKYRNQPDTDK